MNLCIISYGHISKTRGGVDRVTDVLSEGLKKKGHIVYLLSVCPPIDNDTLSDSQFQLPSMDVYSMQNKHFLQKFYDTKKIDIILNQAERKDIFDLICATHENIPIISCIHNDPKCALKSIIDLWDECKLKLGWKFYLSSPLHFARAVYRYYNRRKYISGKYQEYYDTCDAIVLLSKKFYNNFNKLANIKDHSKLYAISNPNSFTATDISVANKEKIVLFVGRQDFQKRVDRLLRIWKIVYSKNQEWKLQIIGDGTHKFFYEILCRSLKLKNVEFLGKRNPEDYYKKASILCITSSHEGLPMVMIEALQYEVIPIAYNSFESVTDIITDQKTGFIIDKFSERQYSHVLQLLMSNAEYRDKIRNNISEFNKVSKFDTKKIVEKWEHLLTSIYKKGRNQQTLSL